VSADRYTATVTVEALPDPDGVPAAQRVKRWLKLALRGFRLRATDISPAAGEITSPGAAGAIPQPTEEPRP
jgi:hypothetical protein